MRPGVEVITRALPPPRSAPTFTGVGFMVGETNDGPAYALVNSLSEFIGVFGERTGAAPTYDAADAFFREGGSNLYVASTTYDPDDDSSNGGSPLGEGETRKRKAPAAGRAADAAGIDGALGALVRQLGPGQVFLADPAVGKVKANQSKLLAHAAATNRVAILSPDDGTAAELATAGKALQTETNASYGALFAPSAIVPGVVAATSRKVPYAAIQAGIIGRNDRMFNPNVAAAGTNGQALYTLDIADRFTDLEYQTINEASCNMARVIYGGVRTYGFRSCVDWVGDNAWNSFGYSRLRMGIVARAQAIGEEYVFSQIDGRGLTLSRFAGELSSMLGEYYAVDALYGATPEDAFDVDVGPAVNTPETIANGELRAVLRVRMSPFAEKVVIEIVKVATTQSVAAAA